MSNSNYPAIDQADIVIVGGGLVGATLALALNDSDYKVVVLEAFSFGDAGQPSFDDRSVAIAYGSSLLLRDMGLWSNLTSLGQPIEEIRISERGRLGLTRMSAAEEGVVELGRVIENRLLGECFAEQMSASSVDWRAPAVVEAVTQGETSHSIDYRVGQRKHRLEARLLVAADGAQSSTREALGLQTEQTDYGLSAVIANVEHQLPHRGQAFERFTKTGPLAFLPLTDFGGRPRSSLVWTLQHDEAQDWLACDETTFLQGLGEAFGQRLGRLQKVGQRAVYPVSLTQSKHCATRRAVVLGNAAQALNPVAGQGFNLGLRDVATLVDVLLSAQGGDPGADSVTQEYQRLRQPDRRATIRFTDGLIRLFSNDIAPLSHARAGGLLLADVLEPLRQRLVRQGMGLRGRRRLRGGRYG
ncbi:2-polyprenyl-6-methoxyphenol 4-hydroxylase [gamma proteobacterium HTCC5015]|nr:2-polyprenyl-6-methoxyphenol 4-hydroxylase [gamma proteobacterium HTCC5015]